MDRGRSTAQKDVLSWLGLLAVLVLIAIAIGSVLSDQQAVGWTHYVLLTFVGGCYAGSFLLVKRLLVTRFEARAVAWWQRLSLWLATLLIAVFAGTELAARFVALLGGDLRESRANFFPVGFALSAAALVIDYGYEQLKRRAREFELREEQLRRAALRAELAALQARTDPHFLFNSLNTLAGLIEEDAEKAGDMLEKLSGLFRYALEGSRSRSVALADEVRAVADYLQVESVRFGDRFTWSLDAAPGLGEERVPPLFLQPLVENALVHGVAQKRGAARIDIRLRRENGFLHVEVEDDGPGPGTSPIAGSGDALENVRERLNLFFGSEGSLKTGEGSRGGFRVTVDLPLRGEETEA
jgi:two-component system, LytTR family, sensor histidine kinase AlgZ